MTPEERERLAVHIAAEIERTATSSSGHSRATWLAVPVRPEPPARAGEAPPWSGAGQSLGDVAPIRDATPSVHRDDAAAATAAIRAAAAGKGTRRDGHETSAVPATGEQSSNARPGRARLTARRRLSSGEVTVPVGVSRRHVHLSEAHVQALFGSVPLEVHRTIRQPGQFAAVQRVSVVGPEGTIEGIRVVGPARGETQLELARSDAALLGIDAPLAASGTLEGSCGGVSLVAPHGRVTLARGVIIAARHLHVSPGDAARWGLRDGDRLDIRCGSGARAVTWHDVLVRAGSAHATEFHLDENEAHAAGVASGCQAHLVGWHEAKPLRRVLVTERDLLDRVQRGEPLPTNAILTPGARDRARVLGIEPA